MHSRETLRWTHVTGSIESRDEGRRKVFNCAVKEVRYEVEYSTEPSPVSLLLLTRSRVEGQG
jgi:hypothetical protein